MSKTIQVGRLLRADTQTFTSVCHLKALDEISFGALVRVPLDGNRNTYGVVADIRIGEDGTSRMMATVTPPSPEVIADVRSRGAIPAEVDVLAVGEVKEGQLSHAIPSRPPLSLEEMFIASGDEVRQFVGGNRLGYLRHFVRKADDLPLGDLLAAHLNFMTGSMGHDEDAAKFKEAALDGLVELLASDFQALMDLLAAVSE